MSIVIAIVSGVAMGLVFGFALEKSRVFEPGMIVGQMQFRNFVMLKVFLAAAATGMVVLAALGGLGLVDLHPKATLYAANLVGGVIFGAGMVLAGACPGTVAAQIGAGYRDAWLVLLGAICGAMAFGYAEPAIRPLLLEGGPGKLTLDGLLGLPYWLVALAGAAILVGCMIALERLRPWRDDLGSDYDGMKPLEPPPTPRPSAGHSVPAE